MNTLVKRTISGAVYCLVLIASVLLCKYTFLVLMLFFLIVMMREFLKMTMGDEYIRSQWLSIFTGVFLFTLVWAIRAFPVVKAEFVFLALIPLFIVMVNSLYVKDKTDFGKFANIYTALLYVALPMSICNFLVMDKDGAYCGWLLICFFLIIWSSDIGAYIFGMSLGQKYGKRLCPEISPKKSWIGFWGGLFVSVLVSMILFWTGMWTKNAGLSSFTWYHAAILGLIMCISGVYGDMFESQWKRYYEVKDSGNIIPGHGGMLDRLDSSLFAIPIGVIYLSIFKFIVTL